MVVTLSQWFVVCTLIVPYVYEYTQHTQNYWVTVFFFFPISLFSLSFSYFFPLLSFTHSVKSHLNTNQVLSCSVLGLWPMPFLQGRQLCPYWKSFLLILPPLSFMLPLHLLLSEVVHVIIYWVDIMCQALYCHCIYIITSVHTTTLWRRISYLIFHPWEKQSPV